MALIVADRVQETTNSTGTGAYTLGGAVAGFQAFAAEVSNGDTVYYSITDNDNFEVGLGTYASSGGTIARTTVFTSSNSNNAVNWGVGTKNIFLTYPADKAVIEDASNNVTIGNNLIVGGTVDGVDIQTLLSRGGGTMTGNLILNANPTAALQSATKQYVDTIAAAGIHYHEPCRVETTANLNATYSNGSSGVGATLTNAGTQAALVLDGVSVTTNDRVMVQDQTNKAHNGVYKVTTVGSGGANWVLTRATDADSYGPSDTDALGEGDAFFITEGAVHGGELDVMTTTGVITFGTTNIVFTLVADAPIYSAGAGLSLSGTQFSLNTPVSTATALATGRTISLTGDATGSSGSFNGTGNASINTTVAGLVGKQPYLTIAVTVANPGAGNRYYLDGALQQTALLQRSVTVRFDQSNSSNSGHPLRLSTTSNGSHGGGSAYTTGVTVVGTPGSSGAYTQVTLEQDAPINLFYYCTNHSGMGGKVSTGIDLTTTATPTFASVTADLTGSATTLANGRTIGMTGDVVWTSAAFDGSGNVTGTATIQANSVALGTDTTGNYVQSVANGSYLTGGGSASEGTALTLGVDAASGNTASKVVARDSSGNFSAGTITAALTGNASTATTLATARTIGGTSFNGSTNIAVALANTATTLATARNINGVSFNGSANITVVDSAALPKAGGTMTGNISHAGNFTIDVGGDLKLDADSGLVYLADGGTDIALLNINNQDLNIRNVIADKDIYFQGNYGGSTITALELDMSDQGTATFNHDIKLPDNGKAIFGAGSDLQIYHDGSDSYIKDAGTGDLFIQATDQIKFKKADGSEYHAIFADGGSVDLYYAGVEKFKTASSGISVTGNVTVTGTVDGRDVATDGSKLDGIASGATNVTNNNQLTNGAGYTTNVGDITGVTAGSGLDGGGTSGTVSLSIGSDVRASANQYFGNSGGEYIYYNNVQDDMRFFVQSSEEMRLESDGDLHVDGNVIAYSSTISDERLKKDIVKIDNALDKISQLNGYTFKYIADGKKSAGVIAQEVEKVMPSAITESTLPLKMGEDDKTEYKTVQYDQLHGLMIEAIKELKVEIEELKAR